MNSNSDVRRLGLWLEVRCRCCTRSVAIPHRMIPPQIKDDLPCRLAAAFFRCKNCGSKDLTSECKDITQSMIDAYPSGKRF